MVQRLTKLWRGIRQLSGDDAYERYLAHFAEHHANQDKTPLAKAEFFKRWQESRWDGIKRCC